MYGVTVNYKHINELQLTVEIFLGEIYMLSTKRACRIRRYNYLEVGVQKLIIAGNVFFQVVLVILIFRWTQFFNCKVGLFTFQEVIAFYVIWIYNILFFKCNVA